MKQTLCRRHAEQRADFPTAARLSEYRDAIRIAAELAIPVIDDGALAELALNGPTPPLITVRVERRTGVTIRNSAATML